MSYRVSRTKAGSQYFLNLQPRPRLFYSAVVFCWRSVSTVEHNNEEPLIIIMMPSVFCSQLVRQQGNELTLNFQVSSSGKFNNFYLNYPPSPQHQQHQAMFAEF